MKRLILRIFITPDRLLKLIASCVSWFMSWCRFRESWGLAGYFANVLRRIADIIDMWNAVELPPDVDRRVERLVRDAITDEKLKDVVDYITSMSATSPEVVEGAG